MTTHKMTGTKEYQAWRRMKDCCYNPSVPSYKKYGAKGFKICESWKDNFPQFVSDMGNIPVNCNGLIIADGFFEFSKYTCHWGIKKQGRPPRPIDLNHKDMYKKIRNGVPICLTVQKELIDFIRAQALELSLSQNSYISPNVLIREALHKAFPFNKGKDLFGNLL